MRMAGSTLVAAVLLFNFGGVGYTPSTAPPSPDRSQSPAAAICKVPVPGEASLEIELSRLGARPDLVPLNTQGYNYSASGRFRPPVPSTRGLPPAGAPAPAASPAPASPAPK